MKVFVSIVMLLFLPAVAMLFLKAYNREEKKKTLLSYLVSTSLTVMASLVFFTIAFDGSSIYELFLCAGIASIVLSFAVMLFGRFKEVSAETVLRVVCFICVITAVYSILTYGQATLDSDTAMVSLLTKCRMDHKTLFPSGWNYANGDIVQLYGVNTYTTTLPFILLMKNQSLARMIGSAVFLIPVIFGLYYVSKKLFKNYSWLLAVPIICVFLSGQLNITLYQGAYIGNVFIIGVMTTLMYEGIIHRRRWLWVVYFALSALGFTGAMRFFAENAIPMLGAVLYLFFVYSGKDENESFRWKDYKKELLIAAGVFFSSMLVGQGFYRWLAAGSHVNNTSNNAMMFVGTLGECYQNLITYLTNHFACFGYVGNVSMVSFRGLVNLISIGACSVICFIIPILQAKKIRGESAAVQFFFVFGIIHNIVLLVINVCTSLIDYPPRYVLTSVFVWVIISCRYAYAYWFRGGNTSGRAWTVILSSAAILECCYLISLSSGWQATVSAKRTLNQTIAEQGFTKGYASYWNAYNNELYSDFRISYGGVEINSRGFVQYPWLVDSEVFSPTADASFLMLTEGERAGAEARIETQFGSPVRELTQNGMHIYFFDYDIASKLRDRSVFTADEFFMNESAHREEEQIIIEKGGIVFGPAAFIEAGEYVVYFCGDNMDICEYDIHSNAAQNVINYKEESRAEHEIRVRLTILYGIYDIEFRTWNDSGNEDVIFKGVRLAK
ncbi:MAG: hypothetical protein K6F26_10045 [Lachnospiraceae bacterium]|nr:hypothetical protein [Lachnospiraceae bacterium]